MVIVRLRKSRKEQWTYLTAREKRLKEAREYVCYTHITYHKLSINGGSHIPMSAPDLSKGQVALIVRE